MVSHLASDHVTRTVSQLFGVDAIPMQFTAAAAIAFSLLGWPVAEPTAERSDDPTIAAHFSWLPDADRPCLATTPPAEPEGDWLHPITGVSASVQIATAEKSSLVIFDAIGNLLNESVQRYLSAHCCRRQFPELRRCKIMLWG
jgi:hypothetical protein